MTRAHRSAPVLLLTAALAVTGIACSSDDDSSSTATTAAPVAAEVEAKLFMFQPATLEVPTGATVTWTNGDDTIHEPTSGTPEAPVDGFVVELDGIGATGSHTFTEPGTYPYFCALHESMVGEIVVG